MGPLVHAFVSEVLDHYKAFQVGQATREAAIAATEDAAKRYGRILATGEGGYHLSSFLADGSFRAHVRADMGIMVPSKDPNESFWHYLGIQVIKAAKDLDGGTAPEEVGPHLQVVMRSSVNFILGLGG